jgi:hypothetical protein
MYVVCTFLVGEMHIMIPIKGEASGPGGAGVFLPHLHNCEVAPFIASVGLYSNVLFEC